MISPLASATSTCASTVSLPAVVLADEERRSTRPVLWSQLGRGAGDRAVVDPVVEPPGGLGDRRDLVGREGGLRGRRGLRRGALDLAGLVAHRLHEAAHGHGGLGGGGLLDGPGRRSRRGGGGRTAERRPTVSRSDGTAPAITGLPEGPAAVEQEVDRHDGGDRDGLCRHLRASRPAPAARSRIRLSPSATRLTAGTGRPAGRRESSCRRNVQNLLKTKLLVQATQKATTAASDVVGVRPVDEQREHGQVDDVADAPDHAEAHELLPVGAAGAADVRRAQDARLGLRRRAGLAWSARPAMLPEAPLGPRRPAGLDFRERHRRIPWETRRPPDTPAATPTDETALTPGDSARYDAPLRLARVGDRVVGHARPDVARRSAPRSSPWPGASRTPSRSSARSSTRSWRSSSRDHLAAALQYGPTEGLAELRERIVRGDGPRGRARPAWRTSWSRAAASRRSTCRSAPS